MDDRPPTSDADGTGTTSQSQVFGPPDPDRKRQLARDRQRRKRDREQDGLRFYRVAVSPAVLEALMLRSIDGGMTEAEAERAIRDRRKVSADLSDVDEQWAARYISERGRR